MGEKMYFWGELRGYRENGIEVRLRIWETKERLFNYGEGQGKMGKKKGRCLKIDEGEEKME